ncbi:SPOR domain-containing protein [Hyphomicrobium sp. 1Nfss2.1]|uniref:SPOR domain-containing protein n=1 Tax=Hyphomicrobium sp. 1Nfss2.1 TaxID=3413936 RepID=UPI003C7DFAFA
MSRATRTFASTVFLLALGFSLPAAADIADEILAKAIERYRAGETEPAIGGINAALRGRLSDPQLAKAYYYRGLAHRRAGRPNDAISDLTQALSSGGLSESETTDATESLHAVYRELGTGVRADTASVPAAAEPARSWAPSDVAISTGALQEPKPEVPAARPKAWAKQQVSLAPLPPARKQSDASTTSKPRTTASSTAALTPFVTEVSIAPAQDLPPSEIRLLVGQAHSRSEAVALAVRLTSQRGFGLGPRRPQIAETAFADSAIYRVRLGPFANLDDALALCRSLRDSGYDCVRE